jgi:hypothetical protein
MPSFNSWMKSINTILFNKTGFEISDLPDEPFRDFYDDGLVPSEVVNIMVDTHQWILGCH